MNFLHRNSSEDIVKEALRARGFNVTRLGYGPGGSRSPAIFDFIGRRGKVEVCVDVKDARRINAGDVMDIASAAGKVETLRGETLATFVVTRAHIVDAVRRDAYSSGIRFVTPEAFGAVLGELPDQNSD